MLYFITIQRGEEKKMTGNQSRLRSEFDQAELNQTHRHTHMPIACYLLVNAQQCNLAVLGRQTLVRVKQININGPTVNFASLAVNAPLNHPC